jgi:hypothetical protein
VESLEEARFSGDFAEHGAVTLVSEHGNANLEDPVSLGEERRAALHRERAEAIAGLREQITAFEEREPELRKEIPELEKTERTTIAQLERTQHTTIAGLEKTQRATIGELEKALRAKPENADELEDQLEQTRTRLAEELDSTRAELDAELASTRAQFSEELTRLRAELAAIGPGLIEARCTLGMKMSDLALEDDEGHEQAVEYLKPLLVELRSTYGRALSAAKRDVAEAEEKLKALEAEHHETPDAALPAVEQRFQPLIDAEVMGVSVEQAKVRIARHQLALADSGDGAPDEDDDYPDENARHLARELELEAAQDELDAARTKVLALQDEKRTAVYHYSHPAAEKSKRLGKQLAKRFGRSRPD